MLKFSTTRPRGLLLALSLLLLLALQSRPDALKARPAVEALPGLALRQCASEASFRQVRGLGKACRLSNGSWKVKLRNGTTLETHGPDPAPPAGQQQRTARLSLQSTSLAAPSPCVTDPADKYYALMIYARASDRPDNYAQLLPTIREQHQMMQTTINNEAAEGGVSASLKVRCASGGVLHVENVTLPTPFEQTSFDGIVSDLQALGYTNVNLKYWIYFDGRPPAQSGTCGVAGFHAPDDRASVDNNNNGEFAYASYATNFACGWDAMLHEATHIMGGVQPTAPNSDGSSHCNDGQDIMCYQTDGPRANYRWDVCPNAVEYDCNNDDYFNVRPAAGSYLATHWNIAACYNRFIRRSDCAGTPTSTPTRAPTSTPTSGGAGCWATWVATTAYSGGAQVSRINVNYQAAFWTQGQDPATNSGSAGSGQPWIPMGTCGGPTATATRTATRTPTRTSTAPPASATRTATRASTATRTPTRTSTATRTPTRTSTATGSPAWASNTTYALGARVSYGGASYQCLQAHTSQPGWEPPNAPALWQRL